MEVALMVQMGTWIFCMQQPYWGRETADQSFAETREAPPSREEGLLAIQTLTYQSSFNCTFLIIFEWQRCGYIYELQMRPKNIRQHLPYYSAISHKSSSVQAKATLHLIQHCPTVPR
ncbi:hypothetical protein Ancab_030068 [Ancistrocladus abbreviatus]